MKPFESRAFSGASLTQVFVCRNDFQKNLTELVSILVVEKDEGGAQNNFDIEPQGPMV